MLSEPLNKILAGDIDRALEKNAEVLSKEFAACFSPESEVDPAIASMVIKAMRFSTQLALQLTFIYLEGMHIIELPPEGMPMAYLLDKEPLGSQAE